MTMKKFRLTALLLALLLAVGCAGPAAATSTPPQTPAAVSQTPEAVPNTPAPVSQAPSAAPKAAGGALRVSGTKLVDAGGNTVQLRGVSTHGLAWFPQYVNQACFNDLRSWGANVVRLAMYTAEYGGYCTGGNQNDLKALIRKGVQYASNAGMYVIVDWHILSDGNPNTYVNQAKAFFQEMSAEFAKRDNVLYEICNEPNGGTTWAQIKSYAQQIIPVIRANDPDAVIIVGTPTWSQDVDQAAADPITGYSNIMYALHFYADTHRDSLRQKMVSAVKKDLPIFVTEYGICDASGNGAINESQANQWISALDQYGISYVAWNLSNKAETSSILKSSCAKTGGFTTNDLSPSGQWLCKMLSSKAGPYEEPGVAGFKDVKAKDWFAPYVEYVVERGLMQGDGAGSFLPNKTITRAELAQLLYNMEGKPSGGSADFTDVPKGEWYYDAVAWAAGAGVVKGTGGDTFAPGQTVTREQFAAMLYRYANSPGADLSALDRFPDAADVHDWEGFREAMAWAVGAGVINGTDNGKLEPRRNTSRAEAAAILKNFRANTGGTAAGGITLSVSEANSWDSNGVTFRQYAVTVTNSSNEPCESWAVDLKFDGPIQLSQSWNGTYTVNGSTLHIASVDYNGALAPGASTDVGFIVSGGAYLP